MSAYTTGFRAGRAEGAAEIERLRAELARRDTTIAAVRALCEDLQVEDIHGGRTNADSLWPSEVLDLLPAPVEAGAQAEPAGTCTAYEALQAASDGIADLVEQECAAWRYDHPDGERYVQVEAVVDVVTSYLIGLSVGADAPAEPGYQRIADAIETACDTAALTLDARRDGIPVEEPYLRVARVLDKAGLIDWSAFGGAPAEPTSDTETTET